MPIVEVRGVDLVIEYSAYFQDLCAMRYDGHPRGCPCYGKKDACPPDQPLVDKVLDLSQTVYVIYTEFGVGAHAARMWAKHPKWTVKQAYNLLYWQPKARKEHKVEQIRAFKMPGIQRVVRCPEAHGVHVSALMRDIDVPLEWPPRKLTRLVSLGGARQEAGK